MKMGKKFYVSLMLFTFLFVFGISGMGVKAFSDFKFTDVTKNSVTVDFSAAAKKRLSSFSGGRHDTHTVKVRRYTYNGYHALEQTFTVGAEEFQFTISGLKAGTAYQVEISMPVVYTGGSSTVYITSDVSTRRTAQGYPLTVKGKTDKTIAVSFEDGFKTLKEDYEKRGYKEISSIYMRVGCAAESTKTNTKTALKNARKNALTKTAEYDNYYKVLRNLKPDTTYAVFMVLELYYEDAKGRRYNIDEYFEITGVKTDNAGGYTDDDMGDTATDNSENSNIDTTLVKKYVIGNGTYEFDKMKFNASSTADSITIDWSGVEGLKLPKGLKNMIVSYYVDPDYDAYADYEKYGSGGNYGPNMRKAIKLADGTKNSQKSDQGRCAVPKNATSYTITGLQAGKRYCVVLKCGYKKDGVTMDPCYVVDKVNTTGCDPKQLTDIEKQITQSYMFDGKVTREKDTFLLDWTEARNAFISQDGFKYFYPRPDRKGSILICCSELPEDGDIAKTKSIYYSLRFYPSISFNKELPASKARLYGLDMSKKYVFLVTNIVKYTQNGKAKTLYAPIYFDETGSNYYKKLALGQIKESENKPGGGEDTDKPGDGNSGNDNPGSGDSGSGNSGSGNSGSDNPGSGNSGNGNSGNGNSGSSNSGTGNSGKKNSGNAGKSNSGTGKSGSVNNGKTNSGNNKTGADSSKGKKNKDGYIQIGKKEKNKAWISISADKVKASKLKKKSEKLKVKVDNSKGKVTVKNISAKKLKKYAKISVKGSKVSITLKKGAPKGIYKFKVTVAPKAGIKKTTKTIKVAVK